VTALLRDEAANIPGAPPLKAFLDYGPVLDGYMAALAQTIRSGRTGAEILHGKTGDESIFQVNEEENRIFDRAFSAIETKVAALKAVPWPAHEFHLCDIADGAGSDPSLLVKMGIPAKITIIDVASSTVRHSERIDSYVHNMFQPFPEQLNGLCDFFWLNFVVQDFSDSRVASLLRHLRAVAPRNARLALLNHVLGAHEGDLERFKLEMDLWQMTAFGGRERSQADFERLLAAGGWKLDSVELIEGEACVVTASAADESALELASSPATMPGPWLGRIGSGRVLAVWSEQSTDTNGPAVIAVLDAARHRQPEKQIQPDMNFIGIWESVISLPERRFALLYCSKSLGGPAAVIGNLSLHDLAEHTSGLNWLGTPSSFARVRSTKEHFFKSEDPVELACAMRVSAAALLDGMLLVCHIQEGPEEASGAYCSRGVVSEDQKVLWDSPVQLHVGVLSVSCSNLPMHRFAVLKVIALTDTSWVTVYSAGVLVRDGGRCGGELQNEIRCEGGSCDLRARVLQAGPSALELGPATHTPLGRAHMLDMASFGEGRFVSCFLAQTNFPSLQDEGRCISAGLAHSEGLGTIHWNTAASLGPSAWDIAVAVLPGSRHEFVVAFERGDHGNSLVAMAGVVDERGQVHFGKLSLEGSLPLDFLKAQRPSLAAVSAHEVLLAAADQNGGFQPVVVRLGIVNASL